MSAHDVLLYVAAFVFPYGFFLSFRPPFNLKIRTDELHGWTATLCRWIWPIVLGSGALLATAAFAFKHGQLSVAVGLAFCAAGLFALMIVPGAVAFRQNYGWDRKK